MAPQRKSQSEKKLRKKPTNSPDLKSQQNSSRQPKKKKTTQRKKNDKDDDRGSNKKKKDDKKDPKSSKRKYDHDKPHSDDQKANYIRFLNEIYDLGIQGILHQYSTGLKAYVPDGITRNAFDKNMDKNRYKDVICVDNSRVILQGDNSDYIHGNFVTDNTLCNTFICTQGPMANTIVDFWRMILQEGCENIFMLCQTTEQGKEKCQQYWPIQSGSIMEFSGYTIKNIEVDSKSDTATIISTLEVHKSGDKDNKLMLKHHQWRTWPDRSVPQSVMAPFRLLQKARNVSSPTVVHCSAGVGRTGTVVALEMCLQIILAGKHLSVLKVIQELRTMRMHSVQTDLQMVFICKCLTAFAASRQLISGDLTAKQDKFDTDYNNLIKERAQPDNDQGYTPLVPVFGFGANAGGAPAGAGTPVGTPPVGSPLTPTAPQPAVCGFFLTGNNDPNTQGSGGAANDGQQQQQ